MKRSIYRNLHGANMSRNHINRCNINVRIKMSTSLIATEHADKSRECSWILSPDLASPNECLVINEF